MGRIREASLAVLLVASALSAAPPDLSKLPETLTPEGQYATYTPAGTGAASVVYVGLDGIEPVPAALLADKGTFLLDCYGKPAGTYRFVAVAASKDGEQARKTFRLVIGQAPVPPIPPSPPDPPGPTPPVPPGPGPAVTSFRVIFVHESGDTLTAAQSAVIHGKAVEDYLRQATTPEGGLAGFRRFDPQQRPTEETPTVAALWAAVKPKLTGLPCVVIEVNGHATIEPLPATPAAAVALFKKYRGE